MTQVYNVTDRSTAVFKRISWGAIFAGVVVAVVIQMLLTLLGVGIGAAAIDPLQQSHPGKGMGIGAAIWLFVSSLISIYAGARVAGKMAATQVRSDRMLHGILTWGTTAILSVLFLTTTAGALLGGAASLLGGATSMASQNPAVMDKLQQQMGGTQLSPTGRESDPQQAAQMEQKAREAGDVAAKRVSQSALWSFFLLLVSAAVAAFAGTAGDRGDSNVYSSESEETVLREQHKPAH